MNTWKEEQYRHRKQETEILCDANMLTVMKENMLSSYSAFIVCLYIFYLLIIYFIFINIFIDKYIIFMYLLWILKTQSGIAEEAARQKLYSM
jgi:hypothetical protein